MDTGVGVVVVVVVAVVEFVSRGVVGLQVTVRVGERSKGKEGEAAGLW